jgi:NAD(P)-dependent dehydrogenase (short-subunit alcohol dehydrogenase family)
LYYYSSWECCKRLIRIFSTTPVEKNDCLKVNLMNIIINGGTRGIGREVVNCLTQDIVNQILVTGRDLKALNDLSRQYKNVKSVPLDMSLFDSQSDRFTNVVSSHFNQVDILINLAGFLIAKDFVDITNDEARLMMETNFFGPASVIRILRPMMPRGSHIVNISSMGGFQGSIKYKGLSYYSASKSALACLTECLANEFSELGISVNCLALGSVRTEMLDTAFPGYKAPIDAKEMAKFISDFAITGHKFFNGKILPVAVGNP